MRDMTQAQLHDELGYVPQKGVLFSGTITSNLKFGGDHITDADAEQAAEIAQATEFISAKPRLRQPDCPGGSNVSGGQKQRLSIARAIAKHPQIYLFDDSFSALDYKTDVALRRALKLKLTTPRSLLWRSASPPCCTRTRFWCWMRPHRRQGHPCPADGKLPRVSGNCAQPAEPEGTEFAEGG